MAESLRDQLLKTGLAQKLKKEEREKPVPKKRPQPVALEKAEIDLAKAYALRDRTDREERERAQREAELRAREKKERKQKLITLLAGKALNDPQAEVPRHFSHGNKIRRIYCTSEQLTRLNSGELAIVQQAGRYVLVERELALAVQAIAAEAVVLLCEPGASHEEDDIPADLIW